MNIALLNPRKYNRFAETKVSSQEIDKVNKVILENLDDNSDDSATNSEDDLSEEGESKLLLT